MKKILVVLAFAVGLVSACSKDSLTGSSYTPTCDGTVKSYQNNVAPIIQANCAGCHSNYSSYANLSASKNSVRNQIVSGNMPRGGALSTAQKDAIVCWIDNGAPNN
jgi:hypothetical protein